MPVLESGGCRLENLDTVNVIVGRNGSGKSRFMRSLAKLRQDEAQFHVSYVSPERAGTLQFDPSVEQNSRNAHWFIDSRDRNQAPSFKQQSWRYLRHVETLFSRRLESESKLRLDITKTFQSEYLDRINRLLFNVRVSQTSNLDNTFEFVDLEGRTLKPDDLSSGEAEAVSLSSEVLWFLERCDEARTNVLLLDEPDVHQHPDLQARFAQFLLHGLQQLRDDVRKRTYVVIATHSTALICALGSAEFTTLGTKEFAVDTVTLSNPSTALRKSLAFFGHPLSLAISNDPLLILEGEDDEQVWTQAARTSQGKIRLFPCLSSSVDVQTELERFCAKLLGALYDQPKGFSLRDGDGKKENLEAIGPIQRFRLECYAIENALLADECLAQLSSTWPDFKERASDWLQKNQQHQSRASLEALIESVDRGRHTKLKDVRVLIPVILGSKKPWERIIGQAIAGLHGSTPETASPDTSLVSYIGGPCLTALGVLTEHVLTRQA